MSDNWIDDIYWEGDNISMPISVIISYKDSDEYYCEIMEQLVGEYLEKENE